MVPSAIAIPEMHLAVLAGVFHPVGLVWLLAALVVSVVGGLCVAIAMQEKLSGTSSARRLCAVRLGSEREDVAAA